MTWTIPSDRALPRRDGRVRGRPRAGKVPYHVQPEWVPEARAGPAWLRAIGRPHVLVPCVRRLGRDRRSATGRDLRSSLTILRAAKLLVLAGEDVVRGERLSFSRIWARPSRSTRRARIPSGSRVSDTCGAVVRVVENSVWEERMAGDARRGAPWRLYVELRHAGIVWMVSSIQDRSRPPAYTASSGAPIIRSQARTDVATNTASTATGNAGDKRRTGGRLPRGTRSRTRLAVLSRIRRPGRPSRVRPTPTAHRARCRRRLRSQAVETAGSPAARSRRRLRSRARPAVAASRLRARPTKTISQSRTT